MYSQRDVAFDQLTSYHFVNNKFKKSCEQEHSKSDVTLALARLGAEILTFKILTVGTLEFPAEQRKAAVDSLKTKLKF